MCAMTKDTVMTKVDFIQTIEELKKLNKKADNYNNDIKENLTDWYFDLVVETLFRAFRTYHTDELYNYIINCVDDGIMDIDGLYNIFINAHNRDSEDY